MTSLELDARAHQRAYEERVHIFAVPGRPGAYTTRSKSNPRIRYSLFTDGVDVACSCAGFNFRQSCKHSEALKNRLGREAVGARRGPEGSVSNILPLRRHSAA